MSSRFTVIRATALAGQMQARDPHYTLTTLYNKILGTVALMPETAAYRKHTEKIVNDRLDMVKSEPTVEGLQKKMDTDLIEETILEAEKELSLARRFLEYKPWEPMSQVPPENQWKWPI